jgi:formate dehydrogenase subunit delta
LDINHLIRLANRIGLFFEAMPDRREGMNGIADHLHKFWEPRMRIALLDFIEAHPDGKASPEGLSEIVLAAVNENREKLTPRVAMDS